MADKVFYGKKALKVGATDKRLPTTATAYSWHQTKMKHSPPVAVRKLFVDTYYYLAIFTDMAKLGKMQKFRKHVRRMGVLHARDLKPLGIPHRYLGRLCALGLLVKTGPGVYVAEDAPMTIHLGLMQVAKAMPKGVICLLSALRFHELGTQAPHEIWVALDRRAARPRLTNPQTRIVRFSGEALSAGVEEHDVEGVRVRIYSPAKTVADCFKYRNKVGLDVALEALREALRLRKCTADQLWICAKVCRVTEVMRPYMEAVI
jgi:predicted transcriptional regulator of viral defense system